MLDDYLMIEGRLFIDLEKFDWWWTSFDYWNFGNSSVFNELYSSCFCTSNSWVNSQRWNQCKSIWFWSKWRQKQLCGSVSADVTWFDFWNSSEWTTQLVPFTCNIQRIDMVLFSLFWGGGGSKIYWEYLLKKSELNDNRTF